MTKRDGCHGDETVDVEGAAIGAMRDARTQPYLLMFDDGSATRFELPRTGSVTIGRAPECELCLNDLGASRRHAQITVGPAGVQLADLGSHNGTLVNGERLTATRTLSSGDSISIGTAAAVFYGGVHKKRRRRVLGSTRLRERLEVELERSLRYQRPLSVACARFADPPKDDRAVVPPLAPRLRRIDAVGWDSATQLVIVMPELFGDEGLEQARHVTQALAGAGFATRVGVATCPDDGCEVDTLLAGARAGAAAAKEGAVVSAADASTSFALGDVRVYAADPAMLRVFDTIEQLAGTELPVLLHGETGVGKEVVARALHERSARASEPFVTLNCAALPDTLLESELFGYQKGAFSGAVATKPGLLESARGGTLFLDEVGELSLAAQAKLLRAIETRRFTRLGDVREREADLRLVSATHRDLLAETEANRFRRDLYFRIGGATVLIPALRDRPREILILARAFAEEVARRVDPGNEPPAFASGALQRLATYHWPGNVRELRHAVEYAYVAARGADIEAWHLPSWPRLSADTDLAPQATETASRRFRPLADEVQELEMTRMRQALEAAGGVKKHAAELLGVPRRTFLTKLRRYGVALTEGDD